MKSNVFENMAKDIIPFSINFLILFGIVICLMSITIAGYNYFKKKKTAKEIITKFSYSFGLGILLGLAGLLLDYIYHYELDIYKYRYAIPSGYFIALFIYCLYLNSVRSKNK